MNTSVLPLEEVRASDWARVGGKAARLGVLAANGFPVPPGFVVSADACRHFLGVLDLGPHLQCLDGGAATDRARTCEWLQQTIVGAELSADLGDAILAAHASLTRERAVPCAVRSSATAEDLTEASFAGQHRTYYYVRAERLLEMVRRCWASLFQPEAVSYRTTHGIPSASVAMAVVVQEMVPAEVSGIAFTANPMGGDRGEIVIEASWGMGAAIVDGRVTPDRYVVARSGLEIRERRINEKRFMVPPQLPDADAERLLPVPLGRQRQQALQPEQVRSVAQWSLRCEELFGAPQDVEFALADSRLHLLQSRPVTALERLEFGRGVAGKHVLFKPLAENFTDPLTPLTADLMRPLPPGARFIGGRLYFELAALRRLLPFALSDAEFAEFVYAGGRPRVPLRLSLRRLPG